MDRCVLECSFSKSIEYRWLFSHLTGRSYDFSAPINHYCITHLKILKYMVKFGMRITHQFQLYTKGHRQMAHKSDKANISGSKCVCFNKLHQLIYKKKWAHFHTIYHRRITILPLKRKPLDSFFFIFAPFLYHKKGQFMELFLLW